MAEVVFSPDERKRIDEVLSVMRRLVDRLRCRTGTEAVEQEAEAESAVSS